MNHNQSNILDKPLSQGASWFTFGPSFRASDIGSSTFSLALTPTTNAEEIISQAVDLDPIHWLGLFKAQYPNAIKFMQLSGVYPQSQILNAKESGEKKSDKTQARSPSYTHVGLHSLAVAYCAQIFARALNAKGLLSSEDVHNACIKALLHDCNKPVEISANAQIENTDAPPMLSLSIFERELKRLARSGISEKLISLARATWVESGNYALRRFLVVDRTKTLRLTKGHLTSKIVHLADMMTLNINPTDGISSSLTSYVSPWEKLVVNSYQDPNSELFERGCAINSSGRIISTKKANYAPAGTILLGSQAELHIAVCALIAEEIKNQLAPLERENAIIWAKRFVQDTIKKAPLLQ